jgi:hypothetical protein
MPDTIEVNSVLDFYKEGNLIRVHPSYLCESEAIPAVVFEELTLTRLVFIWKEKKVVLKDQIIPIDKEAKFSSSI